MNKRNAYRLQWVGCVVGGSTVLYAIWLLVKAGICAYYGHEWCWLGWTLWAMCVDGIGMTILMIGNAVWKVACMNELENRIRRVTAERDIALSAMQPEVRIIQLMLQRDAAIAAMTPEEYAEVKQQLDMVVSTPDE